MKDFTLSNWWQVHTHCREIGGNITVINNTAVFPQVWNCVMRILFSVLINSDVLGQGEKKKTQRKGILPAEIGPMWSQEKWVISLLNLSPTSSDRNGEAGFWICLMGLIELGSRCFIWRLFSMMTECVGIIAIPHAEIRSLTVWYVSCVRQPLS